MGFSISTTSHKCAPFEDQTLPGSSFRRKPESRDSKRLGKTLDPGCKGFRFLFVSPFEGLKYSSLRLCRRSGDQENPASYCPLPIASRPLITISRLHGASLGVEEIFGKLPGCSNGITTGFQFSKQVGLGVNIFFKNGHPGSQRHKLVGVAAGCFQESQSFSHLSGDLIFVFRYPAVSVSPLRPRIVELFFLQAWSRVIPS